MSLLEAGDLDTIAKLAAAETHCSPDELISCQLGQATTFSLIILIEIALSHPALGDNLCDVGRHIAAKLTGELPPNIAEIVTRVTTRWQQPPSEPSQPPSSRN